MEVKTKNFKNVLLHWYKDNKREYAWRNNSDPWSIYLLEVISQQTQLDRADKYFNKFIKEFPTPNDMATTSFKKVLTMWSGLGYNSRAKRMFESSKIIAEKSFDDLYDSTNNNEISKRCYYLRVFLVDQKGSMAKFTSILEKNGISIDQVIQRGDLHLKDEKNSTPVIMLTHPVDSDSINSAFSELIKTDLISLNPIFLPVLKDN